MLRSFLALLLLGASFQTGWAAPPSAIAIRNARIVTVSGAPIDHGVVVVRDGLIESVGAAVQIPPDAWTIDGTNLTVYPGLINALSAWGLPPQSESSPPQRQPDQQQERREPPPTQSGAPKTIGPEDRPFNTSWRRAEDLVQPAHPSIAAARQAGFTTAVIFPSLGIFAGQGAVMNLAGEKAGQMVVAAPAGLYLSVSTRGFTQFPGSLMGAIAYIRQIYLDAEHHRLVKAAYEKNPRGTRRPDYDRALEGVLESPRVLLPASTRVEIDRMLRFAAELKQPAVLYGLHEGNRAAEKLAAAQMPVLVNLKWPGRDPDADPEAKEPLRVLERWESAPGVPAALAKAGIRFAFYGAGDDKPEDLRKAVRKAVIAGLPTDQAIRAMTLSAAEIYGVADRLGSIEAGKIANLVVADGDLFADNTKIKFVLVDGVKYEPAPVAEEGDKRQ
jgi:imidazolonepropionase-like amidohydrolase